jgi:hypothetical protein
MPDLLAHALIAYTLARILSWRYEWLGSPYTTVAMAGAFIPDMAKIDLVVSGARVGQFLGLPFDWFGIHTAGGALVAVLIGTVLVGANERRCVFGLLGLGAASHLLADALLLTPTGRSYAILWPLMRYHPPTPGLYLSTQPGPTAVAAVAAGTVWLASKYRRPERSTES